jgi:hypothetical protein
MHDLRTGCALPAQGCAVGCARRAALPLPCLAGAAHTARYSARSEAALLLRVPACTTDPPVRPAEAPRVLGRRAHRRTESAAPTHRERRGGWSTDAPRVVNRLTETQTPTHRGAVIEEPRRARRRSEAAPTLSAALGGCSPLPGDAAQRVRSRRTPPRAVAQAGCAARGCGGPWERLRTLFLGCPLTRSTHAWPALPPPLHHPLRYTPPDNPHHHYILVPFTHPRKATHPPTARVRSQTAQ